MVVKYVTLMDFFIKSVNSNKTLIVWIRKEKNYHNQKQ